MAMAAAMPAAQGSHRSGRRAASSARTAAITQTTTNAIGVRATCDPRKRPIEACVACCCDTSSPIDPDDGCDAGPGCDPAARLRRAPEDALADHGDGDHQHQAGVQQRLRDRRRATVGPEALGGGRGRRRPDGLDADPERERVGGDVAVVDRHRAPADRVHTVRHVARDRDDERGVLLERRRPGRDRRSRAVQQLDLRQRGSGSSE